MAQNLWKHLISICAKKKVFSIFNTKEVTAEKQKSIAVFGNFFWKLHLCVIV